MPFSGNALYPVRHYLKREKSQNCEVLGFLSFDSSNKFVTKSRQGGIICDMIDKRERSYLEDSNGYFCRTVSKEKERT